MSRGQVLAGPTDADTGERRRRLPQPSGTAGRWRLGRLLSFKVVAVLPLVAFMAVFALYPLVELVRMTFSTVDVQGGAFTWQFSGLANLSRVPDDPVFRVALWNTFLFIVVTTAGTIVIGVALALLVDRSRLLGGIARNVLVWPAIIAPVVVSVIWWLLLSPEFGLLNRVLTQLGLPTQGWLAEEHAALPAVMLVDIWHWTPIVFVLVYAALTAIDTSLYEAARIDGASEWQIVRHVVLPILAPAIVMTAVARVVMGVKVFDEMWLLTHGGPGISTTIVSIHIRGVFFDNVELGYGAALGLTVVVGILAVFLAVVLARAMTARLRRAS